MKVNIPFDPDFKFLLCWEQSDDMLYPFMKTLRETVLDKDNLPVNTILRSVLHSYVTDSTANSFLRKRRKLGKIYVQFVNKFIQDSFRNWIYRFCFAWLSRIFVLVADGKYQFRRFLPLHFNFYPNLS